MTYKVNNFVILFVSTLFLSFCFAEAFSTTIENNNAQQKVLKNEDDSLEKDFYILGPGDILSIKFLGVEELSGNFAIMRDGNIQLPLLGPKKFNGLTLSTAKTRLIDLYKDDLLRPEIDLSLIKTRPVRVSLIGEVQRPGSYTLDSGESSRVGNSESFGTSITGYLTVVDAIQKAGGLTFDADITSVTLYRKLPGNKNRYKKAKLNLLTMLRTGRQMDNPFLFDGDTIKIDKLIGEINKIEKIPNNLTPETIKLHVIGEVSAPGMYTVDSKTQISQAILIAGGPNSWRYKDKIQLLRVNRNGSVEVKNISFNKQGLSKKSTNISLRNGDIIRVKKNFFGKSTDALGTFLPPVRDIYSLYGVYKLLE